MKPFAPSSPSSGSPWRLFSWSVGAGVLLLAFSFGGAALLLHSPSRADGPANNGSRSDRRAVAVAFVDVEGGVRQLYPVQHGQVVALPVKENEEVAKGTPLLRIDDTLWKIKEAEAEIDLEAGRKHLEQAKLLRGQHKHRLEAQEAAVEAAQRKKAAAVAQADKAKRYFKEKIGGSAEDVRAAEQLVAEAEAGIRAEQAKLELIASMEKNLRKAEEEAGLMVKGKEQQLAKAKYAVKQCTIFAPCKGKLLRTLVGVGEVLGPNPRQAALEFCPSGPRIVRAEVEQEFATRVVIGQKAKIEDDSTGGGEWHGRVKSVSDWYTPRRSRQQEPLQFNDVRTLEVILQLENDSKNPLRIGQRVRVLLDGTN